jgi:AcrR family transcriptional regulator
MPETARPPDTLAAPPGRRARRHEETREKILDLAIGIMAEDGTAGLSMARLARAMSIRPPSLYKYFASLMAIYDALFRRGHLANLAAMRDGMRGAEPGVAAVAAGLEAAGRWAVSNPALAQLLFWRPVPGFEPTPDAYAPAQQIMDLVRDELGAAAAAGQIHPDSATGEGLALLTTLHFGMLSQHLANEPGHDWEQSTFTRLHPRLMAMFVSTYPPPAGRAARTGRGGR